MPGGRLTYADRQAIAAGLASGLSHAAIARRLGRPTSTITREVTRNGGSAGYRPSTAQAGTELRASRRARAASTTRSAREPAAGADADQHGRDPQAVREYEEFVVSTLEQSGLSRMAARVAASLYVTDSGSMTSAELVQRLQVSPASISKAVAFLESQGMIRRDREAGKREVYIADDDVWYRMYTATATTNRALADAALKGADVLGRDTRAGQRMWMTGRFLELVGADVLRAAERWWKELSGEKQHPRR